MAKRTSGAGIIGFDGVRRRREDSSSFSASSSSPPSLLTDRSTRFSPLSALPNSRSSSYSSSSSLSLIFKDLTSRPEYNDILVKKPGGSDWWPY
ncbi:hypothetical protein DH2020_028426 [Rehmannia glutinosa]|uniref:Uncharacterized protein n=1 Tax=Rehmannia glutinosa TaxID=99300 RepID=A0ABR0VT54_REHGL